MGKQQKLKEQRRVQRQIQAFDAFHEAKAAEEAAKQQEAVPPTLGVAVNDGVKTGEKFGG